MRQVGFEIELMRSDKSVEFNPTCPESFRIGSTLEEIAGWVTEENDENLRLEFSPHEQSLSYRRCYRRLLCRRLIV